MELAVGMLHHLQFISRRLAVFRGVEFCLAPLSSAIDVDLFDPRMPQLQFRLEFRSIGLCRTRRVIGRYLLARFPAAVLVHHAFDRRI